MRKIPVPDLDGVSLHANVICVSRGNRRTQYGKFNAQVYALSSPDANGKPQCITTIESAPFSTKADAQKYANAQVWEWLNHPHVINSILNRRKRAA